MTAQPWLSSSAAIAPQSRRSMLCEVVVFRLRTAVAMADLGCCSRRFTLAQAAAAARPDFGDASSSTHTLEPGGAAPLKPAAVEPLARAPALQLAACFAARSWGRHRN